MAQSFDMVSAVGADIRQMRETAGLSQQAVADLFGWTRDAMSKIERGVNRISASEYLEVISFLGSSNPNHPGNALYRYLRTAKRA